MAPPAGKRRRGEEEVRKPKKKINFKRQKRYHSSSEDEDESEGESRARDAPKPQEKDKTAARTSEISQARPSAGKKAKPILKQRIVPIVQEPESDGEDGEDLVDELEKNTALNMAPQSDADDDDEDGDDDDALAGLEDLVSDDEDEDEGEQSSASETSGAAPVAKKRNDPSAFATSISRILDTKLTTSKRADPVLSRSRSAAEANKSLADGRLEQQARAQIRAEKKAALERGRVQDVLGLDTPHVDTGAILEQEKRLKKTAQRGVVKLFNAVRAAQVKAEQGMREAREQGVVGMKQREERVLDMSKQGFLDLISAGGKKSAAASAV